MTTDQPIRVEERDGMWNVDYGNGVEQNFPTRGEAVAAAEDVAMRDGRSVDADD